MSGTNAGPDYPSALWMPTSHYWTGFGGQTPKWIILHGTAGGSSAQGIAQYFQTNDPPTSTHYVIGQDGVVVQCVAEANSAWGNGILSTGHDAWWSDSINPNLQTFSIEHVKPSLDNSDSLTAAQQAASFALVAYLCKAHGIPPRAADANGGITGHFSIDPVNRSRCPGPYPWTALWAYLAGGAGMGGVPSGWQDDGTTLTAPNGHKVVHGFRDYILNNTWSADDQPIGEEAGVSSVLHEDGRWHGGTRQLFVFSGLFWASSPDPAVASGPTLGRIPMGNELQYVEGTLNWLNSQITTLTSQVSDLTTKLNAANQQIAQLQQQLNGSGGTGGSGGTTDPKAAAALQALQELKSVLGQL